MPHSSSETCFLCGMTSAFIAISRGNAAEAVSLNRWSAILYAAVLTNGLPGAAYLSSRLLKPFLAHRDRNRIPIRKEDQACKYSV